MNFNKQPFSSKKAKIVVKKTATKTVKFTFGILIWIFIILIVYISFATLLGYLYQGNQFLTNIATISIGGFWAFLFGYFGWRLGQSIEEYFNQAK